MSAEEVKATVRRVVEGAYNQGNLEALDQIYTADLVYHRPPLPDIQGLEAVRRYITDIRTAFSGIQLVISEIILDGDTHAGPWTLQVTHTGRSAAIPVPSTGRRAAIGGCTIGHWVDDKIVEEWSYVDWLGLFHQLGVIPPLDYYRQSRQ